MIRDSLISVVVPTYNREKELVLALESVLNQTYRQVDIVVVDDGSTDATMAAVAAIVARRQGLPGPTIRYFHQVNKGQSAARNKGIAEAIGDWIAFLDSDDLWLPEKLDMQVQALERFQQHCGACFTDARLVDTRGLETTAFKHAGRHYDAPMAPEPDAVRPLARAFGGVWVQTLLARSELVKAIGGFDTELHFAEDYDFLFRLSLVTGYCYVNRPLAVIDRTSAVIDPAAPPRRWDRVDFRLRGLQLMYEKWLSLKSQYPEDVRRIVVENLRGVHSSWTNWYLEQEQFGAARSAVSRAMAYQVTPQLAVKWALTWLAPRIARRVAPRSSAIL